jgi:hypothetical protein
MISQVAGEGVNALRRQLATMPLVDHHVHSVFTHQLDRSGFESALTEAPVGPAAPLTAFDSQLGFQVRRLSAPVLDLPAFADPETYLARRAELGVAEITTRLTRASGITDLLIDGGYGSERLFGDRDLAEMSGARVHTIVRLESVAEACITESVSGVSFVDSVSAALQATVGVAVGYKTVVAYRHGLAFDPAKPSIEDVIAAAELWHAEVRRTGIVRLEDATIIRHLIWWALERGAVVQFHTGFGDPDLVLARANPLMLQPLIERAASTGARFALLHCYPFEREAGYLCHAYSNVVMDVGLAVNYLGANAASVIRNSLDLAPFGSTLFSTDAWGLPELIHVGAELWRRAMADVLTEYIDSHGWPVDEAVRVAGMIGSANAERIYSLRTKA